MSLEDKGLPSSRTEFGSTLSELRPKNTRYVRPLIVTMRRFVLLLAALPVFLPLARLFVRFLDTLTRVGRRLVFFLTASLLPFMISVPPVAPPRRTFPVTATAPAASPVRIEAVGKLHMGEHDRGSIWCPNIL